MSARRGTVLLAVLAAVTIAALAAATVLFATDAQVSASAASLARTQSRSNAWSALQAVTAQLADQREDLLLGEPPAIDPDIDLYETDTGRLGVARLVAIGPDGELLVPEGGKLDVNHATAEMLTQLDAIDSDLAERIVAARPFASVHDLLGIEGIDHDLLYGSVAPDGADAGLVADEPTLALSDLLTVFSFDPNVQTGVGDSDEARQARGRQRFNLDLPWTDRLGRALDERFEEGVGETVHELMDDGVVFASDADLIALLHNRFGLGPDNWREILDAIATSDDEFRPGRVDLLTASPEVLAAVPGFDRAIAAEIVAARDTLDDEERLTVCWPAMRGIVTPEEFILAVDHLTTRCMQWRVRIEAGTLAPEDMEVRADEFGVVTQGLPGFDAPLRDRIVIEAVIDVGSMRPRIAELVELTSLDAASAIARTVPPETDEEPAPDDASAVSDEVLLAEPDDETAPGFGDLDFGTDTGAVVGESPLAIEPGSDESPDDFSLVDRRIGRWRYAGTH